MTAPAVRRVLGGLVDPRRFLVVEPVAADTAREQPRTGVAGKVEVQDRHASELLPADLAAQLPFGRRVPDHVPLQLAGGGEGPRAVRALVRPPALVYDPDVLVAAAGPSERLPAPVALEPALVGVRPQVHAEIPGRLERPTAAHTQVRSLVAVDHPVAGQRAAVGELPTAD